MDERHEVERGSGWAHGCAWGIETTTAGGGGGGWYDLEAEGQLGVPLVGVGPQSRLLAVEFLLQPPGHSLVLLRLPQQLQGLPLVRISFRGCQGPCRQPVLPGCVPRAVRSAQVSIFWIMTAIRLAFPSPLSQLQGFPFIRICCCLRMGT